MIKALGRKLNCLGSEDALTASVFGLMRYLPPAALIRWLSHAQLAPGGDEKTDAPWSRLSRLTKAHFWPRYDDTLKGHGEVEPDLVLEFDRLAVIIEAKLRSGKTPAFMAGPTGEETEADQLARQVSATLDFYDSRESGCVEMAALIYVTADLNRPEQELEQSVTAIKRLGRRASPPLYWLSWSALGPILDNESTHGELPSRLIAEDLLEYLREANVLRFRGWRLDEPHSSLSHEGAVYAGWSYRTRVEKYFDGLELLDTRAAWTYRQNQEGKQ